MIQVLIDKLCLYVCHSDRYASVIDKLDKRIDAIECKLNGCHSSKDDEK